MINYNTCLYLSVVFTKLVKERAVGCKQQPFVFLKAYISVGIDFAVRLKVFHLFSFVGGKLFLGLKLRPFALLTLNEQGVSYEVGHLRDDAWDRLIFFF